MEKSKIFEMIQKYLIDVPVLLIGTGVTIPMGIPGMWDLSKHLCKSLGEKYENCPTWCQVVADLEKGVDLESALTGISPSQDLINDIAIKTWEFISTHGLQLHM